MILLNFVKIEPTNPKTYMSYQQKIYRSLQEHFISISTDCVFGMSNLVSISLSDGLESLFVVSESVDWLVHWHGMSKTCLLLKKWICALHCWFCIGYHVLVGWRLYFCLVVLEQFPRCYHRSCVNDASGPWAIFINYERGILQGLGPIALAVVSFIFDILCRWIFFKSGTILHIILFLLPAKV